MTRIKTTLEVYNNKERIKLIDYLSEHIEEKIVEITSSAGVHTYIYLNGSWEVYISGNN